MSTTTIIIVSILIWLVLCIVCASIASAMGRKFISFFTTSLCFSPLVGFIVLLIKGRVTLQEKYEHIMITPHVFFCPSCRNTYINTTSQSSSICPYCSSPSIETSIMESEWMKYPANEQTKMIAAFEKGQYKLVEGNGFAYDFAQTTAEKPVVSNADEIMKYKKLLDCGAITEEEYEKKKQQLLGM